MNILLTHAYFLQEDEKERQIMRPYPPLGLLYVSAWLEQAGLSHEVIDTTFSSWEEMQSRLLSTKPDILAVYVNLMTRPNVLRMMEFIRSESSLSHARIILGGPEVANSQREFLDHGADFLVLGEGEESARELIDALKHGGSPDQVTGISFLRNGEVVNTGPREKLKNLDVLPMPNRTAIDMQRYFDAWRAKHGESTISINTMRGCPYTCKWCSRAVYGLSYRRRSPEHVALEMRWIRERYDVDSIWFVDDVFTISHKWLNAFCEALEQHGLNIPYECITRADRMNDEVIAMLKRSGCKRVWIGAESGSQRIIDRMDRRVEVGRVREMIRATRKAGMEAGTFIMVGYPGETIEDLEQTVDHLKQAGPDQFTITITYPIRGTELYEEVAPHLSSSAAWSNGTDRDLDFERTYPRKFYDYAVRWMVNEVHAHKASEAGQPLRSLKHKAKSSAMRWMMRWPLAQRK